MVEVNKKGCQAGGSTFGWSGFVVLGSGYAPFMAMLHHGTVLDYGGILVVRHNQFSQCTIK
jgi:hypothetical protein